MTRLTALLRVTPKWVKDTLFVALLLGAYVVASIWVLPRLGFET